MNTYRNLIWLPIVIGLVMALSGVAGIVWPEIVINILPVGIGVIAIIYGVGHIGAAWALKDVSPMQPAAIGGAAAIVVGLVFILNRTLSVAFIGAIIGVISVAAGIGGIVRAYINREGSTLFAYSVLSGALSVIFGLLILINPFETMAAFAVLMGIYLVLTGISIIIGALCAKDTFEFWW